MEGNSPLKFKNASTGIGFEKEAEALYADLSNLYQVVADRIPVNLKNYLFDDTFMLEDFIYYLYFETMALFYTQFTDSRPLHFYTKAILSYNEAQFNDASKHEDYRNDFIRPYIDPEFDPACESYEDDPWGKMLPSLYSIDKSIQRYTKEMLSTGNIQAFPSDSPEESLPIRSSPKLLKSVMKAWFDNPQEGTRNPYSMPLTFYYQALSEKIIGNEHGAMLAALRSPDTSAKKMSEYYKKCFVFLRDMIFISNIDKKDVPPEEDFIARTIMLTKMEDRNKLYSTLQLAQLLPCSNKIEKQRSIKKIEQSLSPIFANTFSVNALCLSYGYSDINSFLTFSAMQCDLLNRKIKVPGLVRYFPTFVRQMAKDEESGQDLLIQRYCTCLLLMVCFREEIIGRKIKVQYEMKKFNYFIRKHYNIIELYRTFTEESLNAMSGPIVSKSTAAFIRTISSQIFSEECKKNQ